MSDTAPRPGWRPLLVAALIYLACATALLWPALAGDNVLSAGARWARTGPFPQSLRAQVPPGLDIMGDSSNAYVPYLLYAARLWTTTHHLPLWKETGCCGAPFVGNGESALFFPTNLLAMLLGAPGWIHGATALAKLVVAALGAWALARQLGMSFAGALLAGAIWGFGGLQSVFLLYTPTNVSMLLPWLLLACDRFARQPGAWRAAVIAMLAGLQHLGGHPETALHGQMLAFALGGLRALQVRGALRAALPTLAALAGAFVIGALLGAVQILPLVEYMLQSDTLMLRQHRLEAPLFPEPLACAAFALALVGALWSVRQLARSEQQLPLPALSLFACTVGGLIAGLHAGMDGSFMLPLASDWFGDVRSYLGPENYLERNIAFAGAALPLAAAGLLWGRPRRDVRVAGFLLALGLLAGYHAPVVSGLLRVTPLLNLAENARLQFLALLGTALLAGWGLDALGRVGVEAAARARLLLVALLPVAGALLALALATTTDLIHETNVPPELPGTHPVRAGIVLASEAARLRGLPPGMAEPVDRDGKGRPVKDLLFWIESEEPPLRAQILWGPALKSVIAQSCPLTSEMAPDVPSLAYKSVPTYLVRGQLPVEDTVPGATTIRLRLSFLHGVIGLSAPLSSPEDPGLTALPFPAQPAPGRAGLQLLLLLLVALLAAATPGLRGRPRALLRGGLVVLVGASLAPFAANLLPVLPSALFYPPSPALDLLVAQRPDARILNLKPQSFPPEIPAVYGVLDVRGYDALYPARVVRLLREATDVPDNRLTSMELLPVRADLDLALLGVMSVRLLTDAEAAPESMPRQHYPGEDGMPQTDPFPVVVNPEYLPRARLASGCVVEPDDTAAIALLRRRDFPRASTVVLERGTPQPAADGPEPAARIVRDDADAVRVEIAPRSAGWLLLADTFYPGWKAFVDGVERPIERADVAFRAIAVGPGDCVVEFRFRPLSVYAGAAISVLAGLGLGAAVLAARLRARRPAA